MKFKDIKMQIKKVSDEGVFTGYAASFLNEDLGGDVIMPGAFAKTIKENPNVPVLWGHSFREVIGVNRSWKEDDKGLYVEGELNLEVQRARETHALMKQGAVKGLSIGYDAVVEDWSRWDKEHIRILREVKLWEYSVTPFPMNPEAAVIGVKGAAEFEQSIRAIMSFARQDRAQAVLSQEQKALIEPAIKQLSALLAAGLPAQEAAKQYLSEPGLHSLFEQYKIPKFGE